MGATGFELSKWYADCVADDGEVIIVYVARLTWRGIHVRYASLLHADPSGNTTSKSTVMNVDLPVASSSEFCWQSKAFEFQGRWQSRQPPIHQTIFESQEGSIRWVCLQPLSGGGITFSGREIMGDGYVERLDMTLPPWKMPIDVLQWGRFQGDGNSVVWIDWQGKYAIRHIWENGRALAITGVSESRVELTGGSCLNLTRDAVLRDGVIGKTVLSVLPKWLGRLPGPVLGIHETKWRSRGELVRPGGSPVQGWAIHEVVQWPV